MGWVFNNPVVDAFAGNLVSGWNFDPADDFTDKIGSNDGVNSGTLDAPGKNLRGRLFNGVNNNVRISNNPTLNITGEMSLLAWIKPLANTTAIYMGKYNAPNSKGYALLYAAGKVELRLYDGAAARQLTHAIADLTGAWHQVIGVQTATHRKLYLDGGEVGTSAVTYTIVSSAEDLLLGAYPPNPAIGPFNGSIDEPVIWNAGIGQPEVTALWNGGTGLFLKQQPTIDSFTATPSEVVNGTNVTLRWRTSNATAVSIDQGIGVVAADGSTVVNPLDTTLYTLRATGPGGTVVSTALVVVGDGALAADNIRRVLGRYRRPRR